MVTASTYLAANRAAEAAIELQHGLAAVAARDARGYRASLLRLEAGILAQQNVAGACERLQEAVALALELELRPRIRPLPPGPGHVVWAHGQVWAQPREHLATATSMYQDMGMTYWLHRAEAELQ